MIVKKKSVIQWNLAIPATLGINESGWISEVTGFQGTLLMYKRMDQSLVPERLAVITRRLVFRGPE